jgi:hypothetical protein
MAIYILHKWSLGYTDPNRAPETQRACLYGIREPDNKEVQTSYIVSTNGKEVKTRNSTYILADIDPNYLDWMKSHGYEYDQDNPIKFRS